MIIFKSGSIFNSKATTLVNPVNCVGVMGKGLALEFRNRFPEMYKDYVRLCKNNLVIPGKPYVYNNTSGIKIINFPTKDHWRNKSEVSYIVNGLIWFRNNYARNDITSVAFPALGCGNGGLIWSNIKYLMDSYLYDLPVKIEIYTPIEGGNY